MYSLKWFFVFAFSFLSLNLAYAAEPLTLCVVTSDIDSDIGKITYSLDNDGRSIEHMYLDTFQNGKLVKRVELIADKLKEGIVLNQKDKYIIMKMQSDNFDSERGGILNLDTLYNALNGERREYEMELVMEKNGPALLKDKRPFNKMHVVAKRSRVFGVIGIEKIDFTN